MDASSYSFGQTQSGGKHPFSPGSGRGDGPPARAAEICGVAFPPTPSSLSMQNPAMDSNTLERKKPDNTSPSDTSGSIQHDN
jgi:hypothetical protein